MIGGLFVDACVAATIALFGWAGGQLGGIASIARTVSAFVAFGVAALVCDPAGSLVASLTGLGDESARIVGTGLAGCAV